MQASRISILILCLLAVACSSKEKSSTSGAKDASSLATFVVDPVKGGIQSSKADPLYQSIDKEKLVNLSACMKDVAVLENVIGVSFSVYDGDKVLKTATTDQNGCIYWTESIPFNSLAQETYITMSRVITATSIHKGSQTVQIAIDPWKTDASAVLDLRFQAAPKASTPSVAARAEVFGGSSLYIDLVDTEIHITSQASESAIATMNLYLEPKFKHKDIAGNTILDSLMTGRLQLRYQLNFQDGDQKFALTEVNTVVSEVAQGKLKLSQPITLLRKFHPESTVYLSIEIKPLDAPQELRPLKGNLIGGKIKALDISGKLSFIPSDFDFLETKKEQNIATGPQGALDFIVGRITVSRALQTKMSAIARPSEMQIYYKACLNNAISGEKILGQNFTVKMDKENFGVITTDTETGCLNWSTLVNFDYMASEGYLEKTVKIQSNEAYYGDTEKSIKIYIDPWEGVFTDYFLIDERFGGPPEAVNIIKSPGGTAQRPAAELIPGSQALWSRGKSSFTVDDYLNLIEIRTFNITLTPAIIRNTVTGRMEERIGAKAEYTLRVLVESSDGEPLASYVGTVKSENGSDIAVAVPLKFYDLRQLATRGVITFQLIPNDPNSKLISQPWSGPFDMGLQTFTIRPLEIRTGNIETLLAKANEHKAAYGGTPSPAIFQQSMGFQTLKPPPPPKPAAKGSIILTPPANPLVQDDPLGVDDFLDGKNDNFLINFCSTAYKLSADIKACTAKPRVFMHVAYSDHVLKVKKVNSVVTPNSLEMAVNANFFINDTNSHADGTGNTSSVKTGADAGLKVPLEGITGIKGGVEAGVGDTWFHTTSDTKTLTSGGAGQIATARHVIADSITIDMNVDVQRCVSIFKKSDGGKAITQISRNQIYFACSSKVINKNASEVYYNIYQELYSSALLDTEMPLSQRPLSSIVRGEAHFQAFRHFLESNATIYLSKGLPLLNKAFAESQTAYDGLFPGLLTPED